MSYLPLGGINTQRTLRCLNCGLLVEPGDTSCPHCRQPIGEAERARMLAARARDRRIYRVLWVLGLGAAVALILLLG